MLHFRLHHFTSENKSISWVLQCFLCEMSAYENKNEVSHCYRFPTQRDALHTVSPSVIHQFHTDQRDQWISLIFRSLYEMMLNMCYDKDVHQAWNDFYLRFWCLINYDSHYMSNIILVRNVNILSKNHLFKMAVLISYFFLKAYISIKDVKKGGASRCMYI